MSVAITKLHHIMVRLAKYTHIVVCENILDKFNIGHCGIKVKVTTRLAKFMTLDFILHNVLCTALICTVLFYFSDDELSQARKLRFILLNMDFKWLALLSFVAKFNYLLTKSSTDDSQLQKKLVKITHKFCTCFYGIYSVGANVPYTSKSGIEC